MSEINESNLLIVDDDQMNREILYRHLKNLGYTTIPYSAPCAKSLFDHHLEIVDSSNCHQWSNHQLLEIQKPFAVGSVQIEQINPGM